MDRFDNLPVSPATRPGTQPILTWAAIRYAYSNMQATSRAPARPTTAQCPVRSFPIGSELLPAGGTHFRVWAPRAKEVLVELLPSTPREARDPIAVFTLQAENDGYFSGVVAEAHAGSWYKYRTDRGPFPDPASRFQPHGPHGPSEVIDPKFAWTDPTWRGRRRQELVIYELHLGTFSTEGNWAGAAAQLEELAQLGVTMIEVMPIAEFPGRFGWGYDGVALFAPSHLYGRPEDEKAFVNRAHELGLAVILDVVYNHLGPDGNYLGEFSRDYFTDRYANEWGQAINFDGENAAAVREFFLSNVRYWIEEFHFDGLRLDATQQIFDASEPHILADMARVARQAARGRPVYLIGENECQQAQLVRSAETGGYGLDALWNDDFHHLARVAATGRAEAYYSGYRGAAQEFVSAIKYGFLYQGQWYRWQQKRRGRPAFDIPSDRFVTFLQNHDQVANSLRGVRLHQQTTPALFRALTAVWLLSPQIPLLFQGQEFAASAPFLYFADHNPELRRLVAEGRRQFLQQFPSVGCRESGGVLADPGNERTFASCRLDFAERERHGTVYRLHRDLLELRRTSAFLQKLRCVDGAVLAERAFVLRYFAADGADHLLLANFGPDLVLDAAAEPLLAPLEGQGWRIVWSSEAPAYGGNGTPPVETIPSWRLSAQTAVLLGPHEDSQLPFLKLSEKD